jgi:hypothetical protein
MSGCQSDGDRRQPAKQPDILSWLPARWELFLGNYRAIKHFQRLVRRLRKAIASGDLTGLKNLSFLMTGESRSGKTALVKFLIRSIICKEFDEASLNPCAGGCAACRHRPESFGLAGLHSYHATDGPNGSDVPVHFSVIDCTTLHTPDELRQRLWALSWDFDGIRILYFDEVHRLVHRGMDEMLLKAMEERQALWFFSTAKPEGLEDMFKNRCLKVFTELPAEQEMATWLADRCNEWGICWQREAILRVVEKSNRVVGTALHAIALAGLDDEEGLSMELVENDWIVKIDG